MSTFLHGDIVRSRQYGSGRVTAIDSDKLDAFGKPMPVVVVFDSGRVENFTANGQLQHGTIDWQFMISPYSPNPKGPMTPEEIESRRPDHGQAEAGGTIGDLTEALDAAREALQEHEDAVILREILDAISEWQSGCSNGAPGECKDCTEALIDAIRTKANRRLARFVSNTATYARTPP